MTGYRTHLRAVLAAFFAAAPDVSPRALSLRAGLGPGWVSEFLRTGRANMEKADAVIAAALDLCPDGAAGDDLRSLVGQMRIVTPAVRVA